MKISVQINDPIIKKASYIVMTHYSDEKFIGLIEDVKKFNYTEFSSKDIANSIKSGFSELDIEILGYKTLNPFSSVIGHASGRTIFVNSRKLNLPLMERVQNLFHEATHLIGYKHNGNRPNAYNMMTVPYKTSNIFMNYVRDIYER